MAYFFKWQNLPKMLNAVFSTSAGHDHDGTNSKAVTVGTIAAGALDGTHKILAAGEKLYLSVTNGTTAAPPAFLLQLTYTIAPA